MQSSAYYLYNCYADYEWTNYPVPPKSPVSLTWGAEENGTSKAGIEQNNLLVPKPILQKIWSNYLKFTS